MRLSSAVVALCVALRAFSGQSTDALERRNPLRERASVDSSGWARTTDLTIMSRAL
jgi:hypothetical protein